MRKLNLIICVALWLAGCGGSDKPAANPAVSGAETGVASCDEYLAKVEKFIGIPQVPQATKDAYRQSLEQNRIAWKQVASTAQGKQQLESNCELALESAKSAFDQYNK